jgi:hypothetical protein
MRRVGNMNQHVKISFKIEQDDSGYPPDSCERVWAKSLGNGNYEIDNIPFFVYGISAGDEVSALDVDGDMTFSKLELRSTNSTFRLIPKRGRDIQQIRNEISDFGCQTEFNTRLNLIAVEIPGDISIQPFISYIVAAKFRDELDYEEGALRHTL